MVESLAERLAVRIKKANPSQTASVSVMKFALIIVINFLIPAVSSLIFGALTGKWTETLTAMGFFIALRMASGGYHFETPLPCMLASFSIIAIPPHIALTETWTQLLTAAALILTAWLAPANMKGYNTMPEKYYPLLKLASVLIVSANFLLLSGTAAIVLAVQGITLLIHNKEVTPT